jgi:hypothetical protein
LHAVQEFDEAKAKKVVEELKKPEMMATHKKMVRLAHSLSALKYCIP